jgi:hypothetical protein
VSGRKSGFKEGLAVKSKLSHLADDGEGMILSPPWAYKKFGRPKANSKNLAQKKKKRRRSC